MEESKVEFHDTFPLTFNPRLTVNLDYRNVFLDPQTRPLFLNSTVFLGHRNYLIDEPLG